MPSFVLEIDPTTLEALRNLRADRLDPRHDFDAAKGTPYVTTSTPVAVPISAALR